MAVPSMSEAIANPLIEKFGDRILYLAVPIVAYQTFFNLSFQR
ncbi:XisH family protein [Phormidesmis priestleyi]|nr:XisH family protein [Phormidesmis priestleyi]